MAIANYLLPLIPVGFFLLSGVVSFVAINMRQTYRPYLLPVFLLAAGLSFATINYFQWPSGLNSLWGMALTVYVMHQTSILCIEKYVLPSRRTDGAWDWLGAYKTWLNPRLLNTPLEAPGIRKATRPQGKARFAMRCLIKLVLYWAVNEYVINRTIQRITATDSLSIQHFSAPVGESYFRRLLLPASSSSIPAITYQETILHAVFAIHWIWGSYIGIDGAHAILSLLFVIVLRLDTPEEWPPLFGSPLEAYSIRRFWGRFWHRIAYRPHTSCGRWLSRNVLQLRPGSVGEKLFVAFAVFTFSGIAHSLVSWQRGDQCGRLTDIWFFYRNFAAGAVETVVMKLIRGSKTLDGLLRRSVVGKILGYAWVFGFFFWSVPKWEFPKIYCLLQSYDSES